MVDYDINISEIKITDYIARFINRNIRCDDGVIGDRGEEADEAGEGGGVESVVGVEDFDVSAGGEWEGGVYA